VANVIVMLNPAAKTAQKMPAPPMPPATAIVSKRVAVIEAGAIRTTTVSPEPGGNFFFTQTVPVTGPTAKPAVEDLGTQNINGVSATGKRTTLTIPVGQIGNDHPIQVVSETWFSDELKMMVKSSNRDPRFGDTTFELTNINRAEPDASLFQIPADYTQPESNKTMEFHFQKP
jgi:hypothetical protein